ncbi:uncharacterized protein L969DRAFT_19117 [Mixia osmundae IAM 14324]|uniref:AMP-dependent synthetase/ligase domain-containing protein n=1 Tax=Mixia osmundae (strain CBS 9802 / IAM 14324 / JCM 22182 / KY 12970) TaxID=764103 RepID=G7E4R2_MIXOS|nr:uncharacterized protein L969DRAFT_19117 [Mixia osmundae IAM 14324]KEI37643.1 hypothetical protein L969DRAFT_19117 [Mixia osmundae IAM 14324]GAA97822.1 hypothetical protein E5Q_04501 [Mixia osmundae IAM 14324]
MTVIHSPYPDIIIPELSLPQFLTAGTDLFPEDKKLFFNDDISASLSDIKDGSHRLALGLRAQGYKKGDVIAFFAPNQVDMPTVSLGLLACPVTITPANPTYPVEDLAHQLEVSGAKAMFTVNALLGPAREAATKAGMDTSKIFVFDRKGEDGAQSWAELQAPESELASFDYGKVDPKNDVAFICFSSGTSGKPKGVMLSHYNIVSNVMQTEVLTAESFTQADSHIGLLPQYHCYAILITYLSLHKGVAQYVMAKFDLTKFLSILEEHKMTFTFIAPPVVLAIAKSPETKKRDLSCLRRLSSGAAPLSEGLRRTLLSVLPHVVLTDGYGQTEMSPLIAVQQIADTAHSLKSCGPLAPNHLAKIVDDHGKALGRNEDGELLIKGPNMMLGYLGGNNDGVWDGEGFLRTGDIGHFDDRDRLILTDRKKSLIKYKGFQVSAAELEDYLVSLPEVSDAAVVGVYSEAQATELPCGFVVPAPGVDRTEENKKKIIDTVGGRVAYYKKLRAGIVWVDAIPKNPSGKILHRMLRPQCPQVE